MILFLQIIKQMHILKKIKENKFFDENIKIYATTKLFNLNIVIYERKNINENYTQYSLFTPQVILREYFLIDFEERVHYNLLKLKKMTRI